MSSINVEKAIQLVDDYYTALRTHDWESLALLLRDDARLIGPSGGLSKKSRLESISNLEEDSRYIEYAIQPNGVTPLELSGGVVIIQVASQWHLPSDIGLSVVRIYNTSFTCEPTPCGGMQIVLVQATDASGIYPLQKNTENGKVILEGYVKSITPARSINNITIEYGPGRVWIQASKDFTGTVKRGDFIRITGLMKIHKIGKLFCEAQSVTIAESSSIVSNS